MKINKSQNIIAYLLNHSEDWVSAQELSKAFLVSDRQIRKYIVSINDRYSLKVILSSKSGYKIDVQAYHRIHESENDNSFVVDRQNYIIQKLINEKTRYNIYDFAQELHISEESIHHDIRSIKKTIHPFNLNIKRTNDMLSIYGDETQLRILMSHLIKKGTYQNFIIQNGAISLNDEYDLASFKQAVKKILDDVGIYTNDYTLTNTVIHLIVIIDRLAKGFSLDDTQEHKDFLDTKQYAASIKIRDYIKESYDVYINDTEINYICMLFSTHLTTLDHEKISSANIQHYVEDKYIKITKTLIREVEDYYYLEPFDGDFITKITIHIKNMFERIRNNYYAKNSLTDKIKLTYPFVYDIAVFIAQKLHSDYQLTLTEDEITFIAFHIGAYFENHSLQTTYVSAIFVYADYYSYYKNTIQAISSRFDKVLLIDNVISYEDFLLNENYQTDIIITTLDLKTNKEVIKIQPFITEKDLQNINSITQRILEKKKKLFAQEHILDFFYPALFRKDIPCMNRYDIIKEMTKEVIALDYTTQAFYDDVILRENISSTAFYNVAIPHAMSKSTSKSFISIAIFESGVQWNEQTINIVALIGISDYERKIFSEIFDEIIEIFNNPYNVNLLISSLDFNDFIMKMKSLLE